MTRDLIIGIDIGGTKTHIRCENLDGRVIRDDVFATRDWRGASDRSKAALVAAWLGGTAPMDRIGAVALGAHGCDTDEDARALRVEVEGLTGLPTAVVNDAQLLGAAAGLSGSIELIAGTGSIAVGRTDTGSTVFAGGWGWLLGDDGGGAGLVREGVRMLTVERDKGAPVDLLEGHLLDISGATSLRGLAALMMAGADFASWAPALFAADGQSSPAASLAIESGARSLASLAHALLGRGVSATTVVAAGGVIVNQRRMSDALHTELKRQHNLDLHILRDPPVRGALVLARDLHHSTDYSVNANPRLGARVAPRKE